MRKSVLSFEWILGLTWTPRFLPLKGGEKRREYRRIWIFTLTFTESCGIIPYIQFGNF
jgi:hypothetical protein